MIDIKVPAVGESISEVTLVKWLKKDGDYVNRDEVIAELESEKATFEVNAEKAGSLKTLGKEGDTLKIGDVLASIDETAVKPVSAEKPAATNGAPKAAEPVAKPVTEKVAESQVAEKNQLVMNPKQHRLPRRSYLIKKWMPAALRLPGPMVKSSSTM